MVRRRTSSTLLLKGTPGRSGRTRAVVISAALGLLVMAGIGAAVKIYHDIDDLVRDCYAQWWVAGMVNNFMDFNDGQWPKSWEDLEEPYEVAAARAGRPWTFDELRSRVEVDFSANPEDLMKTSLRDGKARFRVVSLRNGKQHHYEGTEANFLIWEHLQERAQNTGRNSPKRPVPEEREARRALLDADGQWKLDDEGHVTTVQLASHRGQPRYSDDVLALLEPLTELRGLDLGYSNFTDAGLLHLRGLKHLEWIYLYGTKVTDAGLSNLDDMQELQSLVLASENFGDAAFEHILRIPNLRLLNLNGAKVTDESIASLHHMSNLKEVMLGGTLVTKEGVKRLRAALPECEVYFPQGK